MSVNNPINIIIHHDPAGINKRDLLSVGCNTSLLDFLIAHYGSQGFSIPTAIYIGEMMPENLINQKSYIELSRILKSGDIVNIVHRPQGVELLIGVLIAVVAAVVLTPDLTPPPTPENPNFPRTNESPNNRLTGQTNVARPLSRIPDIYGKMRIYPDLGAKTVTEFIDHIKHVTEYLVIGRGHYLVEEIKSGDTLIENITGTSITHYAPDEIIPELIDAVRSNEVNGQTLNAPNESAGSVVNFFTGLSGNIMLDDAGGGMQQLGVLSAGDNFSLSGTAGGNDGVYTFVSMTTTPQPPEEGVSMYEVRVGESFNTEPYGAMSASLPATDAAAVVVGAFVVPLNTGEVWIDLQAPRGLADRVGGTSSPITVQIRIILERLDDFGAVIFTETSEVELVGETLDPRFYTFKVIPLVPDAHYQVSMTRLSSTLNDPSYYDTIKWTGLSGIKRLPNFDQGNVTSYVVSTTATDQATTGSSRKFNAVVTRKLATYDTITQTITGVLPFNLKQLKTTILTNSNSFDIDADNEPSVIAFSQLTVGDKFRLTNNTTADGIKTFQSLTIDQINNIYTINVSELFSNPQTNLETNFSFSGSGTATLKAADALLNHLTDPLIGNKKISDLDLDQLYEIQNALDNDATYGDTLGRFCYSFSADKASVKDELITISNACRLFVKKLGNRIEFGRDEIKPVRVSLFNNRNKKPNSEKKTIRLQKPTAHDGIELQWVYQDTGDAYTVQFPEDKTALNPRKIEAAGIRNFDQAWNRAKIEFNKLKLQRESVELIVTKDGLNLQVGDRVANADGTNIKSENGEIRSFNGLVVETSDIVDFAGQGSAVVILRNENGITTEEIAVTPRLDEISGFILQSPPTMAIRTRGDLGYQIGTLYTFATVGDLKIKDYIVQKITPKGGGYVGISLTKYNDLVYSVDTEAPPPHGTKPIIG